MDTPYVFEWLEKTSSTQDDARGLFADRPVVVAAGAQTHGRGRGDRRWVTAPRALAVSVCWAPGWDPMYFGRLPLVAGLAAGDVAESSSTPIFGGESDIRSDVSITIAYSKGE